MSAQTSVCYHITGCTLKGGIFTARIRRMGKVIFLLSLSVHTQEGGGGYLPWMGGGGVPTLAGGQGVPTLDRGVPILAGGWGLPTLDGGGYIPWLVDRGVPQGRYPPARSGQGGTQGRYPPSKVGTPLLEDLLHGGRYTSCVHAGGHSCWKCLSSMLSY